MNPKGLNLVFSRLVALLAFLTLVDAHAQCTNNNTPWLNLTPAGPGATASSTCTWAGEYNTVNVTAGATYVFSVCGATYDTQLTLFSSAGVFLAYNDDGCGLASTITWTATFTGTVWILLDQFPCVSNTTCTTMTVTWLGGAAPSNDPCAGATPVSCGQTITGSTTTATVDAVPVCGGGAASPSLWYSITGDGSTITASLCGSAYDTYITVYSGSCAGLTCVGFNDDGCGLQSQYTWPSVSGVTYYIMVHGFGTSSGSFTLTVNCTTPPPPPPPGEPSGCPDIDLGPDISIPSCPDPCATVTLNADVFATGAPTTYLVQTIPAAPPFPYNTGTGFSIGVDDVYTPVITLPFNFCYFGVNYNQCVVGSNGVLSFNTGLASTYCPWAFTATCPSPALPLNSIFGVYHDINPATCGDARYAVGGTYPCRIFVVSFDNICHFSCTSIISTHMIVLYETTNVIEVFVENKPTCPGWNSGNALIGIQDAAGTTGFWPPSRQTGPWSASNEAWRFTPNGAPNYVVNWYDEAGFIGNGLSMNVCPDQATQTYSAEAVYTRCDGSQVIVTDDVVVACGMIMVPVEWLNFEAKKEAAGVRCLWQTATEQQNDYFTVERSADMNAWDPIGVVDGAGDAVYVNSYSFFDPQPLNGTSYYRIRQTDFNGQKSYSEVRSVGFGAEELVVYPNPANGAFSAQGFSSGDVLKAWDTTGREVRISVLQDGTFSLGSSAPGTYFIQLTKKSGESLSPVRFVLLEGTPNE